MVFLPYMRKIEITDSVLSVKTDQKFPIANRDVSRHHYLVPRLCLGMRFGPVERGMPPVKGLSLAVSSFTLLRDLKYCTVN